MDKEIFAFRKSLVSNMLVLVIYGMTDEYKVVQEQNVCITDFPTESPPTNTN